MNKQQTMMNQAPQQHHQPPQLMTMSQNMMTMSQMNSQPQPQMIPMNRNYGMWAPPPQQFQNPNLPNPNPGLIKPLAPYHKSLGPRSNWKGKKLNKPSNDKRRKDFPMNMIAGSSGVPVGVGHMNAAAAGGVGNMNFSNYQPPALNELQRQNRLKTRKFFPKKKYNNNNKNIGTNMNVTGGSSNNNYNYNNYYGNRSAPFAPRNTTSFLIRAKKSGGIASLVSPSPGTPAVLPTPIFSPSREVLVDTAKEEWGVDGYGSMKGLIRLRSSPGHEIEANEDEEEDEGGSSESDVEEHLEVERRLDHDLSRFEMIYNPNNAGGMDYHNVLENRVDDQDTHIAHLEEENLILKERLFLMEREFGDMRRRLQFLETRGNTNEEVLDNDSENDNESREEEGHSMEDNNEESSEDNIHGEGSFKGKRNIEGFGEVMTVEKSTLSEHNRDELINDDNKHDKCTNVEDDNNNEVSKAEQNIEVTKDTVENNCEDSIDDLKTKAVNNNGVESSEPMMEETGVAKDSA